MRRKNIFINFFQGVVLGVSVLIPGLSGGTMALLLGIYSELLDAVGSVFLHFKKSVSFLLPIGLGALVGFGFFSKIILFVLNLYYSYSVFFFSGIIIGSVPKLFGYINYNKKRISTFLYLLLGVVAAMSFEFLPEQSNFLSLDSSLWKLLWFLFYGAVLAVALILPGVSFSLVLLLSGLYQPFLYAIQTLNFLFLVPFVSCIGLFCIIFSSVLSKFFIHYPRQTYAMIIGFVVVSACQMLADKNVSIGGLQFVLFAVGCVSSLLLEKKQTKGVFV